MGLESVTSSQRRKKQESEAVPISEADAEAGPSAYFSFARSKSKADVRNAFNKSEVINRDVLLSLPLPFSWLHFVLPCWLFFFNIEVPDPDS